ncbi:Rieske (2Fe-2S) protein [Actinocorallia longicatena]|uniref:Rieske domain-containing protein n=1 Tax=Actinocorallia longicatena TaxID=111803 RepID=A0ABP6QHH6_9ACTN
MTETTLALGRADDIPVGEGRAYVVDGQQVAVFRLRDGGLRAVSAVCTHAGGPIADGQIDGSVVICPLHQHTFDLATGCSLTGLPPLRTYDARTDPDGNLVITLRVSDPGVGEAPQRLADPR